MAFRILFFLAKPLEFVHGAASVASQRRSIGHRRRWPATYMAILLISGARAQEPLAGDSTVGRKLQPDLLGLEEGFLRWAIACRWYPRVSMKIPITIMGNDSSCPMEIDPKKNPI